MQTETINRIRILVEQDIIFPFIPTSPASGGFQIPFLDTTITVYEDGTMETEWYMKPTDTCIVMCWYASAPLRYKTNLVKGAIYRIWNATSNYENFLKWVHLAKTILLNNQYPENWLEIHLNTFVEEVFHKMSNPKDGFDKDGKKIEKKSSNATEIGQYTNMFLPFHGVETEKVAREIITLGCMIRPIFTLRKLKSALPSLKARTEKYIQSNVVYKYKCASCSEAYAGYTTRHLRARIQENGTKKSSSIFIHHEVCRGSYNKDNFEVVYLTYKGLRTLEIVESIIIHDINPKINEKDEFRRRQLRLKLI